MVFLRYFVLVCLSLSIMTGCKHELKPDPTPKPKPGLDHMDDFVHEWQIKDGCFDHTETGHPDGRPHVKMNGHYALDKIAAKRVRMKVKTDFGGDYTDDWNKCELDYKANSKGWENRWKETFSCSRPPRQWDYLEGTCTFEHKSKKVSHEVMIWLIENSKTHGKTAPVIFIAHQKDSGLHAGYLH